MKKIGLIGGMSWESTVTYYQIVNEYVKQSLGGYHSAQVILYSLDFDEIERVQTGGDWDATADILIRAAQSLERAGADFILIGTNTMHKVAPKVQASISIPLIHIAEAVAENLNADHVQKVALLGTKYTMKLDFYKDILHQRGIEVLIPDEEDIEFVNHVIYDELCLGVISDQSRTEYSRIIKELADKGAKGVILGCTEIGLLISQKDSVIPVYDTTQIHATKAARLSIE